MTHRGPFQPRTFCDSVILVVFYLFGVSSAAVETYSPHVGTAGCTGLCWSPPLFTGPKEQKAMYPGPLHAHSWVSPVTSQAEHLLADDPSEHHAYCGTSP